MTFQALTGRRVLKSLWSSADPAEVRHIDRTDAADLMLIAPATANIIGKIAAGIADDLVSTMVISAVSPVALAPAMNNQMWDNPVVQDNIESLRSRGLLIVGPQEGWLACGSVGPGRMAEPAEILEIVATTLKAHAPKASTAVK